MASFNEINLQVGAKLQMTVKTRSEKKVYYTELIGYVENDYLIVKIPLEHNVFVSLNEKQRLSFRIFSGVDIFTFSCTVIDVVAAPYHYVHASFPDDVELTPLRCAVRAKTDFPVQISGLSKSATMVDISVSGAGIVAVKKLGEPGEDLLIQFVCPVQLTHQEIPIKTTVKIRNVQQLPNKTGDEWPKWLHGVMFHDLPPANKVILQNFVYESLNRKSLGADSLD